MMNQNRRKELLWKEIDGVRIRKPGRFFLTPRLKDTPGVFITEGKKFEVSTLYLCVTYQGQLYERTQDNLDCFIFLGQQDFCKQADSFAFADAKFEPLWTSYDADTSVYLAAFMSNCKTPLALRAVFQACPAETIPAPKDGIVSITRDPRIITGWWNEVQERPAKRNEQTICMVHRTHANSSPQAEDGAVNEGEDDDGISV